MVSFVPCCLDGLYIFGVIRMFKLFSFGPFNTTFMADAHKISGVTLITAALAAHFMITFQTLYQMGEKIEERVIKTTHLDLERTHTVLD